MPTLKNPRREKFCHRYVFGDTAGNAAASYHAAGFSCAPLSAPQNATRLLNKPEVRARVDELQAELAQITALAAGQTLEKLAITKERVITELANIGFANVLDYFRPDGSGGIIVDLARISRDKAAGIIAVRCIERVSARGDRTRDISIRLGEKRAALVDLGKHLGLFVPTDKPEQVFDAATEEEFERRVAEEMRKIAEERMAHAAANYFGAGSPPAN
jgi:phage terminase small subunit